VAIRDLRVAFHARNFRVRLESRRHQTGERGLDSDGQSQSGAKGNLSTVGLLTAVRLGVGFSNPTLLGACASICRMPVDGDAEGTGHPARWTSRAVSNKVRVIRLSLLPINRTCVLETTYVSLLPESRIQRVTRSCGASRGQAE
jgi:hypothetical protein